MITTSHVPIDNRDMLARVPAWITSARAETLEDVAFLSGAALNHLHLMLGRANVPHALLRDRMALRAAEACVAFSGRQERAGELRDSVHLLRSGDLPGPAGETYLAWRRAVERPVSVKALHRSLPGIGADQIAEGLDGMGEAAVARAANVMDRALTQAPRAEVPALVLADAALARAVGWDHLVPLLAVGLRRADLRKRGDDLRLACHRAVVASAIEAVRLAADLASRAAHLKAVAPKLRAKGAGAAVEMFLTRDAVMSSALPLPDRAARRLCDRLVDLGAVCELTGRGSFRLYGV
ncbi:DUF1403 family protein [Sulfitobacter pseudonitzschiae]|uniref:DUF1403 family protein n=1 Tax=Pseudosulfitobacter pseudonitzschiae TaxID=1402135 RepID=A0A9Q2NT86_9RHOB|nr:DUF1403 family protein [Pseudosulfitobacter pseudonitzschiae]MBM2295088.1 DUF1403 family protein [Pseudosulfitobacter pseudonitzschiae]MBM2300018.1 DUF1403 family protein [Pseudosulfitobacter pseudonitzschiae]MBM2304926.1 DUF1403 family protein [Pseudosulfitobacter pseudonitzschiae]MBM2314699.1 DUF1403 family protein [Pseudosulfitobacter pseudonitzschiae]MBM2319607.1 DUF1403 family protein [Pseudosulfitobacter pseudonitzschiae]